MAPCVNPIQLRAFVLEPGQAEAYGNGVSQSVSKTKSPAGEGAVRGQNLKSCRRHLALGDSDTWTAPVSCLQNPTMGVHFIFSTFH